jgi:hypothetical protein
MQFTQKLGKLMAVAMLVLMATAWAPARATFRLELPRRVRRLLAREGLVLPPVLEYMIRGGHKVYARDHSIPTIASPTAELVAALAGGAEAPTGTQLPFMVEKVALVAEASPANGGLFSWQNPLDEKVIALVILNVTTPASGSATADVGHGTAAATSNDTYLDGINVGAAAIVGNSSDHKGTNGLLVRQVDENGGTTAFITGTASADSSGIVGNAYVLYFPVT